MRLIAELRRRRVFSVVIAYLGAAFVILQVADLLVEPLSAPTWTMKLILVLLVAGFPAVVLLGWFFQTSVLIERDEAGTGSTKEVRTVAEGSSSHHASPAVMRVAVRPFRLLREDAEIEFLEIALADAIAGCLTGIRTLQVRSPLRARQPSGSSIDLEAPDADAVLDGTILRVGAQLRVQVHLARTADGAMLWSESSLYPLDDLISLQDEVAHRVVASLGVGVTPVEQSRLQRQLPANPRAFELYLRANHASLMDFGWAEARDLYRESLQLDPGYAPAWARLGRCYRMLAKYDHARNDAVENLALARSALEEALRLDTDLPLAHNLLA
jgi:TolB-like protein